MEDSSGNAKNGLHEDNIPFIDEEPEEEGQGSGSCAIQDVTHTDATLEKLVGGKFRFEVGEEVVDYDSDESFCCFSEDEDSSTSSCSSGDEGDYDLEVAEEGSSGGESDLEDEVDGVVTDGDEAVLFPWKDHGVVDLETASKWDFTTLTKNCKPVVKEIVERVVSFTRRLRRVEEFRAMVEANSVVAKEDLNKIFLNLDEVLKLQVAVLGGFRKELLKRPLKPRVGRVLRRFIPFLRLHEELACKNGPSRRAIQRLCDKNTAFRHAHDRFKATGTKHSLDDLLFEPYKYIVDLKQLLQRYSKYIQDTEDYHDTTDALSTIKHVLDVIDEKSMEYYEQNTRMLEIRPLFKKKNIEIMKAHRTLKMDGKLCLVSPQNSIPVKCEVFLFNDILLLCTPYLVESWLSSVRIIGMSQTVVTQEGDDIIVVYSPDKVIELQVSKKLDAWFKALTEAADPPVNYDIKDNVVRFDAPLGTRAPRYVPARTVRSCSLCRKPFVRRTRGAHHCHACGKVVCVTCCGHKVSLVYLSEDRAARRVCDTCCRHLQLQTR